MTAETLSENSVSGKHELPDPESGAIELTVHALERGSLSELSKYAQALDLRNALKKVLEDLADSNLSQTNEI